MLYITKYVRENILNVEVCVIITVFYVKLSDIRQIFRNGYIYWRMI